MIRYPVTNLIIQDVCSTRVILPVLTILLLSLLNIYIQLVFQLNMIAYNKRKLQVQSTANKWKSCILHRDTQFNVINMQQWFLTKLNKFQNNTKIWCVHLKLLLLWFKLSEMFKMQVWVWLHGKTDSNTQKQNR